MGGGADDRRQCEPRAVAQGPDRPRGPRPPRTNAYIRSRQGAGASATSGSRSSSQSATAAAVSSTSTVSTPGTEWVTSPNSMAPGTTLSAKYVRSGANEPATRAGASNGPRAVPPRRSPGSTAAA